PARDSLDCAGTHAQFPRNLEDAGPALALKRLPNSILGLDVDLRSAELLSFGLSPGKASSDPLLNHCTLELSKDAHHLKHGLAGRSCRMESLLMKVQVDPERVNFGEELNQILERSTQSVDAPCHNDIELTPSGVPTQAIELRTPLPPFRSAYPM